MVAAGAAEEEALGGAAILGTIATAASEAAPIVMRAVGELRSVNHALGPVPSWAKDMSIGTQMLNARSETVATSQHFESQS